MHLLLGAVVGAVFAAVLTAGMSLLSGRRPSWKQVGLAALGGAVAGFVGAATLGVGGMATATLGRQVVAFAAGGAAGGAAEQVAENAATRRPLHEGVVTATAVGAGAGVATLGMSRGASAVLTRVAPRLAPGLARPVALETDASAAVSLPVRIITAPTPGTGRGWVRAWEDRVEAMKRRTETVLDALDPARHVAPADATAVVLPGIGQFPQQPRQDGVVQVLARARREK